MNLGSVKWIDLLDRRDSRGGLTILDQGAMPFSIQRLFYLHNVPDATERGGHAHRVTEQVVISLGGTFWVDLTDGLNVRSFELSAHKRGLYVPPLIWDRLHSFSSDAICLVLASTPFVETDYIRDWNEYLKLTRQQDQ